MVDAPPPRRTPATWLSLACLVIAILISPPVLEQIVSLDWKICDMRPIALAGQLLMAVLAALLFAGRGRISVWLSGHGPSGKTLIFTCIALSLSVFLCLAVMEVGLRLFRDPLRISWEPADHKRAQYDPVLGWTYVRNQSVMQVFVKGQPPVPVYTDEQGIRVPTPDARLDPNLPTVIFVSLL
ncbi:MAG: hypothetical protein GY774_07025 [Planctomycetes bacterium]|nr:hypothetical protein [Planctomycetota bacterium]